VHIGGERPAERQPIGAGLLLDDAPGQRLALLQGDQAVHQLRPLDAGLDIHDPALGVERDDAVHRPHVDEHPASGELLTAHGMPPAGDCDRLALAAGRGDGCRQRRFRGDRLDAIDAGGIELRVGVVDENPRGFYSGWNQGRRREGFYGPGGIRGFRQRNLQGFDRHTARLDACPTTTGQWSRAEAQRFRS
jgi:hypothetical protein